jgi:hypothetical protein
VQFIGEASNIVDGRDPAVSPIFPPQVHYVLQIPNSGTISLEAGKEHDWPFSFHLPQGIPGTSEWGSIPNPGPPHFSFR